MSLQLICTFGWRLVIADLLASVLGRKCKEQLSKSQIYWVYLTVLCLEVQIPFHPVSCLSLQICCLIIQSLVLTYIKSVDYIYNCCSKILVKRTFCFQKIVLPEFLYCFIVARIQPASLLAGSHQDQHRKSRLNVFKM